MNSNGGKKSKAQKIDELSMKVFNDLIKLKWWVLDFYNPVVKRWPEWKEDEIKILWSLSRQGGFMCILLNHIHPNIIKNINPLIVKKEVDEDSTFSTSDSHDNLGAFISACNDHLFIPEAADFNQLELYLNNLESYYTCLTIIEYLLSRLKVRSPDMFQDSLIDTAISDEKPDPGIKDLKKLNHLYNEFIETERLYVYKIEQILGVRRVLENSDNPEYKQAIATLDYFKSAVNFQQLFLLNLEAMYRHHKVNRNISKLFITIGNEKTYNFEVYNEFCSNYKLILDNVLSYLASQSRTGTNMKISIPPDQLTSYFILPIQRICKYPLLLKEYKKSLKPGSKLYKDTEKAQNVSEKAANSINLYSKEAELRYETRKFVRGVNFFPDIPYSKFGSLLFFTSVAGIHNDVTHDYILYIFENCIVLCTDHSAFTKSVALDSYKVDSQSSITISGSILPHNILEMVDVSSMYPGKAALRLMWMLDEDEDIETKLIVLVFPTFELLNEASAIISDLLKKVKKVSPQKDKH